jgi:hypothetical protein
MGCLFAREELPELALVFDGLAFYPDLDGIVISLFYCNVWI